MNSEKIKEINIPILYVNLKNYKQSKSQRRECVKEMKELKNDKSIALMCKRSKVKITEDSMKVKISHMVMSWKMNMMIISGLHNWLLKLH